MSTANQTNTRRKLRNRSKVRAAAAPERPRLSVYRSSKYIYAQLIDDVTGTTIAQAGGKAVKEGNKTESAAAVGKALAAAATEKGVKAVVFDRGQYRYHGRVKALADAAREGGLDF
ncbi:50S ribosomal protein L18 [Deinococcus psychrotolerans]|uniref:Large ribosomal subunit protein uL18 n=2 Tax=Deinococcus TaxID=1298 RepID=A0A553V6C3_9DEIO|nr:MULTISPECIES: 50S ribosomal protein L18 [Deinococcus]AZI42798.1 50S ribosomal protein L18 [Deinococcus psychrotolerans]TSA87974.1 50S ribosomal protein L18 [Deinococcus detaillensis]